ncbi:MAG: hypothetical protein ACRDR6_01175 [Pseudonocardiaceae bacterium]
MILIYRLLVGGAWCTVGWLVPIVAPHERGIRSVEPLSFTIYCLDKIVEFGRALAREQ